MDTVAQQHCRFSVNSSLLNLVALAVLSLVSSSLSANDIDHESFMANLERKAISSACHIEIEQHCSNAPDQISCLNKLHLIPESGLLGACCSAKLHETGMAPDQQDINYFAGMRIPSGSKLVFDYFCETATVETTENTRYKGLEIVTGPMVFGSLGNLKLARLAGQQTVQDLLLDEEQPITQFYDNGVPKQVQLASISEQNGIKFKAIEKLERHKSNWANVPTDLLYQLAISHKDVFGKNATMLHSSGRVARGNVAEAVEVNGLPIAPGLTTINESGNVVTGKLSRTHLFNGLLLGAGEFKFRGDGQLWEAILAAGATLNEFSIDRASTISLDLDGKPERLKIGVSEPFMNSISSTKLGPFWLNTGDVLKLYPNGQVKALRTSHHSLHEGKIYPSSTEIRFDQQGDIVWDSFHDELLVQPIRHKRQRFEIPEVLPTAEVRGGRLFPKGSLIYPSYRNGEFRAVVPYTLEYHGLTLAAGELRFDGQFNIREAYLEKDTVRYGALIKAFPSKIYLSHTGEISSATLANDTVLDGIEFAKAFEMQFAPDGQVLSGIPTTVTTIDGRAYKPGRQLVFDSAGELISGVLARSTKIGSSLIPADSSLYFQRDNSIKVSTKSTITVNKVKYTGAKLALYNDGSIKSGVLAKSALINGELELAGTMLDFHSNGDLRYKMESPMQDVKLFPHQGKATVIAGREKLEPIAPMTLQECQRLIGEAKQRRGIWLTRNSGWSLNSTNFFQECMNSIVAEADQ